MVKVLQSVAALSAFLALAKGVPTARQNKEILRGVCVGGFFLLEPFITPSVFDNTQNDKIVDEWTFGELQDKEVATKAINDHLDTFITEEDFAQIRQAGLTDIRLPIPHWMFLKRDYEPYIVGNRLEKLREVLQWARNNDLMVLLDVHSAFAGQNGFDNDGQLLPEAQWPNKQENLEDELKVIKLIKDEFVTPEYADVVSGVQLLNEPATFQHPDSYIPFLKQYYQSGYDIIDDDTPVTIHDGFQEIETWNGFLDGTKLDTHKYQVFSPEELKRTDQERVENACMYKDRLQDVTDNHHFAFVGEWTAAITDCTKYLNGRKVEGARYEGKHSVSDEYIGSCEGKSGDGLDWSDEYKAQLRLFWEAQVDAWNDRYYFWTWKTENSADWSYQRLLELGVIPQDPSDYTPRC